MPTVPRNDQGPIPTSPLPGVRVSTQAPAGAFGGQPMSIDPAGLTRHVASIIETERAKADQVAVLEADNALADVETALLYDPKTGVLNRKGKTALGAPEEVKAEWEKRTHEVERKLTTEQQQLAFRSRVASRWHSLDNTVQRHVASEIQQHDNETANSALANRLDRAIRSGNLDVVATAVAETRAIVADYGRRNGWAAEVTEEKRTAAVSRIHAGVIEQMLSLGNDRDASAYFADNQDAIIATQLPTIQKALEQASTDGAGARAADAVWRKLGPQGANDPVKVATMEQALRDELGDETKVIRAAIAEVRSRASAFNAEQSETTAANKAALLGAFNEGASLTAIKSRPEYRALSGSEQESLSSYIEGRSTQRSDRAEAELTKRQFGAYWQLSSARALASMSENTILSLETALGRELTGHLMQQKRALAAKDAAAEARVFAVSIDEDLFKSIANEAGLRPYDRDATPEWREQLGRLKVAVEQEIARSQQNANRALNQVEKRDIMLRIVDQKVMIDYRLKRDQEVIGAMVRRDSKGRLPDVYVPFARIPADYKHQALNWLRSIGAIRADLDDATALDRVGDRIARAYAARLAGGTTAEIQSLLTDGRPLAAIKDGIGFGARVVRSSAKNNHTTSREGSIFDY